MHDDSQRYAEHLQGKMLDPDWSQVFDAASVKKWVQRNASRLAALASQHSKQEAASLTQQLERQIVDFQPATSFEIPWTKAIFEPLLERIRLTAERIHIRPIRSVQIWTSTDKSPSPSALPTSSTHWLFIGLGTASFCNYWAKVYTSIFIPMASCHLPDDASSQERLKAALSANPSALVLASRLALYYAVFGTLLSFGEVEQPESYSPYRCQLVQAMELFIIAHEFVHFIAEERVEGFQGFLESDASQQLEDFCDRLGLTLSREASKRKPELLGLHGSWRDRFSPGVSIIRACQRKTCSAVSRRQRGGMPA